MNAKEHLTGVMVEFEGVIGEGAGRARGGRAASCGNEEAIGGCGSQVVDTDVIWHRLMKGRKRETERVKRENRKHRRRGGGERGRRREGGGAVLMTCVICIWRMRAISCFMLGFFWHGRLKRDGTGVLSQCNDSICTHSLPLSLSPSLPPPCSWKSFPGIFKESIGGWWNRWQWNSTRFQRDLARDSTGIRQRIRGRCWRIFWGWERPGRGGSERNPTKWSRCDGCYGLLMIVDDSWWFLVILGDSWRGRRQGLVGTEWNQHGAIKRENGRASRRQLVSGGRGTAASTDVK